MFTTQHDLGVIPANTTTIRYAIPSGVTIKSISLRNYNDDDNLKYSGDSDGELNGKTPFTISSINLVKREEISGDYYELSLANAKAFSGSPTLSGETITFPAGGNQFGWDMSEYDLSNFQYLVVVPKAQFESGQNQIQYAISDVSNTNTFWGFAYGTYQRHRIAVLDIQNTILPKSNNDLTSAWAENAYTALDRTKYTKIYFQAENPRDFEVSAVFLTNTLPTFQNEWYGADQCNGLGDHVRTAATAGTYGTVCLPYDAAICGADAYTVVGVDKLDNPSALYLEKVTGILKKGVSYIYETKSSTENCGNAAFYKVGSATTATPTGTNLIGTFSDNTEVPNGSYILKDGVWKKSNGSAKVNANRAYLTLTSDLVVPAAAPGMIIMDISGSEVTGIETVHGEGLVVNDSDIYDLSGRKVSQPTKGIYVKNGKKYVVK